MVIRLTLIQLRGNQACYLFNYFLNSTPLTVVLSLPTAVSLTFALKVKQRRSQAAVCCIYMRVLQKKTSQMALTSWYQTTQGHNGGKKRENKICDKYKCALAKQRGCYSLCNSAWSDCTLLSRIVDRECAERVVRLSRQDQKQDVGVVGLRLDQEERFYDWINVVFKWRRCMACCWCYSTLHRNTCTSAYCPTGYWVRGGEILAYLHYQ